MQKKFNLSFPIDSALDKRVKAEVKRTGLSRADVARMALRAYLWAEAKEQRHATR
jgi:hypothetical protein